MQPASRALRGTQRPRPSERTAGRIPARRTELAAGSRRTEGLPKEKASQSLTMPRGPTPRPSAAPGRRTAPEKAEVFDFLLYTRMLALCHARNHTVPTSMSQQSCRTYLLPCRALPSRRAQRGAERPHAAPRQSRAGAPRPPLKRAGSGGDPAAGTRSPPPQYLRSARTRPGRPPPLSYPIGSSVFWPHRWPRGRLPFRRDSPL